MHTIRKQTDSSRHHSLLKMNINFRVICFLFAAILISTVAPIMIAQENNDIHKRDVSVPPASIMCNETLIHQAKHEVESAVEKANCIYNSLELFFKESLSPCDNSTVRYELMIVYHLLLI